MQRSHARPAPFSTTGIHAFGRGDAARFFIPPAIGTGFFWLTSLNTISLLQGLAAFGLLCVPLASYATWKRKPRAQLPFFATIAFVYWIYFAIPLFWGDRTRPSSGPFQLLPDDSVTQAMFMALLGVIAIWAGMSSRIGSRFAYRDVRDIPADPSRWAYLRLLLVAGTLLSFSSSVPYLLGEEGRQFFLAIETFIPLIVFVILLRNYLRGAATRIDKYTLALYLAAQFILGLGSGWLGSWLFVALAGMAIYVIERKRLPLVPIALAVIYVLFFQAGKAQYRATYWQGGQPAGNPIDQVAAWAGDSWSAWDNALLRGDIGPQLFHDSVMRASLLTQTANVADLTPRVVPYQYGRTYKSVLEGLVPRLVWPSKPSVNEANQFYQVSYGLTSASGLGGVSIAVGTLTEGYINFGWIGVVAVMFLIGVIFDLVESSFLHLGAGSLSTAIGVAILLQFIVIESQLAAYVGGLLQRVALALVLIIPATLVIRPARESTRLQP